jgi:hypothetical protein
MIAEIVGFDFRLPDVNGFPGWIGLFGQIHSSERYSGSDWKDCSGNMDLNQEKKCKG